MNKTAILIIDDHERDLHILNTLSELSEIEICWGAQLGGAPPVLPEGGFALVVADSATMERQARLIMEIKKNSAPFAAVPVLCICDDIGGGMDRFGCREHFGFVDYIARPLHAEVLQSRVAVYVELNRLRLQNEAQNRELDRRMLEIEVLCDELAEKTATFEQLSSIDLLTGLFNRRYFDDNLMREWKQSDREKRPVAMMIANIDSFKEYITCHGRDEADSCLTKIAHCLYASLLRPVDIIARYDAGSFAAILPSTSASGAQKVAERMLDSVRTLALPHNGVLSGAIVTVSVGGASVVPDQNMKIASFTELVDSLAAAAQKEGGNRIRLGGEDFQPAENQ